MKLCHIKCDFLVHIICSKCPPSAKTHALRRLRKSLIALLIVVCGNWQVIPDLLQCTFYPRDAMLARVIATASCPSVCLSVTRRYCVKTKKASVMISSPSGSPKTLICWRQISSPNSKRFPRTGASNKGRLEKFSDFLALSVNISKTVRPKLLLVTNMKSYMCFRLTPRSMTLDDLELV